MKQEKRLIIIPGYGETKNETGYKELTRQARRQGYRVIFMDIEWNRTTVNNWLSQARDILVKYKNTNTYILGFSFGALIAILLAKEFPTKLLLACSLSPYFKEDIPRLPPLAEKMLGKRRMEAFANFSFPTSDQKTIFLIGDKDMSFVKRRVKTASQLWKNSKYVLIKNTGHDISASPYVETLKKLLK